VRIGSSGCSASSVRFLACSQAARNVRSSTERAEANGFVDDGARVDSFVPGRFQLRDVTRERNRTPPG
jgi:hypothetical protein